MLQHSNPIIDFSNYVSERTQNFTGREWVFQAINDWLADPKAPRFFLITGKPGSGKTAIAARLYQLSSQEGNALSSQTLTNLKPTFLSAAHFCLARDSRWTDPRIFTESLASQLASNHPIYKESLAKRISEGHQVQINVKLENIQAQNVAGVIVRISGDFKETAFNQVIREPLEAMYRENPSEQVVILVDALDEALIHSGEPNIMSLISRLDNLTARVRFIVTSRNVADVESKLLSEAKEMLFISDSKFDKTNYDEISSYIKKRLTQESDLASKMAVLEPQQADKVIDKIATKADGNFLYVRVLLDAITKGQQELSELEKLPTGLDNLYHEFLGRMITPEEWSKEYAPLVGILSVAKESLTESQLQNFTGLSERIVSSHIRKFQQFVEVVKPAKEGQIGEESEPQKYKLYHQSFVDFLHQKFLPAGQIESNEIRNTYYLPENEWHKTIAGYYWRKSQDGTKWRGNVDEYCLRFLADHLHTINEKLRSDQENEQETYRQRLYQLARNEDFQTAQIRTATATINLPLTTIQYALMDAAKANDAASMAEFMLTHARVVSSLTSESPLQTLRNEENIERAWQSADLYDRQASTMWHLLLAWELESIGKSEDARRTLRRLIDKGKVGRIRDSFERSIVIPMLVHTSEIDRGIFTSICKALLVKDDWYYLCDQLANAGYFQLAMDMSRNSEQPRLFKLATKVALLTKDAKDIILPVFNEKVSSMENWQDKTNLENALSDLMQVCTLAEAKDFSSALSVVASSRHYLFDKSDLLANIALALPAVELKLEDRTAMFNQLIETAFMLPNVYNISQSISGIVAALSAVELKLEDRTAMFNQLIKIASSLKDAGYGFRFISSFQDYYYGRSHSISGIAAALSAVELKLEDRTAMFNQLIKVTNAVENKFEVRMHIALAMAITDVELKDRSALFKSLIANADDYIIPQRPFHLFMYRGEGYELGLALRQISVAVSSIRQGDTKDIFESVIKAAKRITSKDYREEVVRDLHEAHTLAQARDFASAVAVSAGESAVYVREEEGYGRTSLGMLAIIVAQARDFASAIKIAQIVEGNHNQNEVVEAIARTLADEGYDTRGYFAELVRLKGNNKKMKNPAAFHDLVLAFTQVHDATSAIRVAEAIENDYYRADVLCDAAQALFGLKEQARVRFPPPTTFWPFVSSEREQERKSLLSIIIKTLTGLKIEKVESLFNFSVQAANDIRNRAYQVDAFRYISYAISKVKALQLAQAGDATSAIRVAEAIENDYYRADVLCDAAQALFLAGLEEEAWTAFTSAVKLVENLKGRFSTDYEYVFRAIILALTRADLDKEIFSVMCQRIVGVIAKDPEKERALVRVLSTAALLNTEILSTFFDLVTNEDHVFWWFGEQFYEIALTLSRAGLKEQEHIEMFYKIIKLAIAKTSFGSTHESNPFLQIARALATSDLEEEVLVRILNLMVQEVFGGWALWSWHYDMKNWMLQEDRTSSEHKRLLVRTMAQLKVLARVKAIIQAKDFSAAIRVADEIENEYYRNEALRHIVRAIAQDKDFRSATKVVERITDETMRAKVLVEISLAAVKSGMISAVIDIASAINLDQERHLYTILSAIIESESSKRDQFKRLLIPCAYYIDLAYRVCGFLTKVYPNQTSKLAEILTASSL